MITMKDYTICVAAEIVICFMLRGFVMSTNYKARHDNELVRYLGFTQKSYAVPLTRHPNIYLENPSKIFSESSTFQINVPPGFVPYYLQGLSITRNYSLKDLIRDLSSPSNLKKAAEHVLKFVVFCSSLFLAGKKVSDAKNPKELQRLITKCGSKNIKILHGYSAVLFLKACHSSAISWLLQLCECHTTTLSLFPRWKFILSMEFERIGVAEGACLCVPGESIDKCGIVFPMLILNSDNLRKSLQVVAQAMRLLGYTERFIPRLETVFSRIVMLAYSSEQRCSIDMEILMKYLTEDDILEIARSESCMFSFLFAEPIN